MTNFLKELNSYVEKSYTSSSNHSNLFDVSKSFADGRKLKSMFYSESWVYICLDLIATKIASQSIKIYSNIDGVEEVQEGHPLERLLEHPNEDQDFFSFVYQIVVEYFLMGNSVVWHAAKTGQLIPLQTENITLDFDATQKILTGYIVNQFDQFSGLAIESASKTFKKEEIIHFKRPNPDSLIWGLSSFCAGQKSILFDRYTTDYLNAFFERQATPSLALTIDKQVNEESALRQLRSFELAYQGAKNSRKTMILPKGVDLKILSHSLGDQKIIEHIDKNRETILGLLKVPKHELSLASSGSLGSEENKQALKNFWEATLKPATKHIAGMFNKFFSKQLGENLYFKFDLSKVDILKDDLLKKATLGKEMLQAGLTVNEVRSVLWQKEELDLNTANIPIILAQQTLPQTNFNLENKALTDTINLKSVRDYHTKALEKEELRTQETLVDLYIKMFKSFIDISIKVIKKNDKTLPSKKKLNDLIEQALKDDWEETYIVETAKTLTNSIDVGYDTQLQFVLNEQDKTSLEALRAKGSDRRRDILVARGLESFDMISKTRTERVMNAITNSVAENEGIDKTIIRVRESLGLFDALKGNAQTIARTETLTAVSIGQAAAIKNAEEVFPKGLKKQWLTARDSRVRDTHADLDGDIISSKGKFSNGLKNPRELGGDASEVINCRCTVILIPPKDKD